MWSIRFRHPLAPAAGVTVLAFSTAGLWPSSTDVSFIAAAGALALALLGAAAALPLRRLPAGSLVAVPVGCDLLIALLRQAQGGSYSGYGPLVVIPIVWTGLVLGRRAVLVVSATTALLFAVPIVIEGSPLYPSSGWRGALLWALIALAIGLGAERVMHGQEEQSALLAARANELDRLAATQHAIGTASFDLDAVMSTVVEEARQLTKADAAVVEIPDGDELVYRAVSGGAEEFLGFRLSSEGAISGLALRTGETLACDDSELDERTDRGACRRVGARSLVVVPLFHDGRAAGVLKVYSAQLAAFGPGDIQVLTLLAGTIGSALARADLLERLNELALTDELTGVPNRRSWSDHFERALSRARRSRQPLSVVVLDLNDFKNVNDVQGHAAGDRLLRTAAAYWSRVLRETDVLGRIGGDEFAVVLEHTGMETAATVADRLAKSIPAGEATVAVGVAEWDGDESEESLLARADAAMYADKGTLGR